MERELAVPKAGSLSSLDWSPDGGGFFAVDRSGSENAIMFLPLTGKASVLWRRHGIRWGVPSPDGKHLAMYVERLSRVCGRSMVSSSNSGQHRNLGTARAHKISHCGSTVDQRNFPPPGPARAHPSLPVQRCVCGRRSWTQIWRSAAFSGGSAARSRSIIQNGLTTKMTTSSRSPRRSGRGAGGVLVLHRYVGAPMPEVTWRQIYDPLNAWPVSTAIAALPVITLFFVLVVLRQRVWCWRWLAWSSQ